MDSVPQQRHRLHALLTDFDAVLAVEYDALRRREPERLYDAIAHKQRLTAALDGFSPSVEALKPAAADTTADDEWNAIQRLLSRCALANRTNGAAIEASRSFVTSLLDIVTGRSTTERTYTARGRISATTSRSNFERV